MSNCLYQTEYIFLSSSQLTKNINWPCYLCCHSFLW